MFIISGVYLFMKVMEDKKIIAYTLSKSVIDD